MKAYVTSIGEPTTELCKWALERNGFEVILVQDDNSLANKLKAIYMAADFPFLRVDADTIVNRNMTPELLYTLSVKTIWWWQFITFDWFKQDITHSMSYIVPEALPSLRKGIKKYLKHIRPETQVSRIAALHSPRRMETYTEKIMGLHGYGIKELKPVIKLKADRQQLGNYDFELAERLNDV